jgi:hypothetical protein
MHHIVNAVVMQVFQTCVSDISQHKSVPVTHQIYTQQVEAKKTNPRSNGKVTHNVKGEFVP